MLSKEAKIKNIYLVMLLKRVLFKDFYNTEIWKFLCLLWFWNSCIQLSYLFNRYCVPKQPLRNVPIVFFGSAKPFFDLWLLNDHHHLVYPRYLTYLLKHPNPFIIHRVYKSITCFHSHIRASITKKKFF